MERLADQVSNKEEEKNEVNRRRGFARRSYSYAHHIPERRSGSERRKPENNSQGLKDGCTAESQCDLNSTLIDEESTDQNSPAQHPAKKDTP